MTPSNETPKFGETAMRNIVLRTILLLTLGMLIPVGAHAKDKPAEGKLRVLIVTGGHAFAEEPFFALFDGIEDVTYTKAAYPEVAPLLRTGLTKTYDAIVFYDMWANGVTPEQQQSLVELLDSGIGVVALHHTLAAHQGWPEYAKIIGGKYHIEDRVEGGKTIAKSGFLHGQDIAVKVADRNHPITQGLSDFQVHDETYRDCVIDSSAHVLLTTENPTSNRQIAWTKTYKNSRVFYLQLGHGPQIFADATYRTLVARGIRWSVGRPAIPDAPMVKLFNGKDLTGWKAEGDARWEVKDGVLIGKQGANNEHGDLLTKKTYDDFELKVTYKVAWPANTGVWYRYQAAKKCFQADILEYKKPFALSGSLYCPGKLFIAVNEDASIIDREGWNTVVIRAVGTRHVIFMNGTKVADVRDDTSDHGRIGFQIHAGDQFGTMKISVKEVSVLPL